MTISPSDGLTPDGLTEDRLLDGRVTLRQPRSGLRAGLEAVMLAAAIDAAPGGRLAEFGTGSGAAALCLAVRRPDLSVVAIERDPALAVLARANAAANGLGDRVTVLAGDIQAVADRFDGVFANPPFHPLGPTDRSPDAARNAAKIAEAPAVWVDAASRCLTRGGVLTLVWRADTVPGLLALLTPGFGGIVLVPLWPKPGRRAKRVLVRAVRASRAPFALHAGLVLHHVDGTPTEAAAAILRHGARFPW